MTIINLLRITCVSEIAEPTMYGIADAIADSLRGGGADCDTIDAFPSWGDAEARLAELRTTVIMDRDAIRATWYQLDEVEVDTDGGYIDTVREDETAAPSSVVIGDGIYCKLPYGWSYSGSLVDGLYRVAETTAENLGVEVY